MNMDVKMLKQMKRLDDIISTQLDSSKQLKSKHVGGTVCKYWLENRCKKGENCEYLHENIKEKLPECQHGMACPKMKDCPFKHTLRQIKECHFYMNGFCKEGNFIDLIKNLGKHCKSAHIKKELCMNYMIGFCPEGPSCKFHHLKTLIHPLQDNMNFLKK